MAELNGLVVNDEIRVKIKDLELVHASLDDDIADVRLLRGPWYPSRIPPEILCEIFHYYILTFQHSAWTISQVCRAWRRIALGCSTLWNTLYIRSPAPICSNAYRSRHPFGWDCLTTELQAQRAIRRTREAPLRIRLSLDEGIQNPGAMLRVLRIVAGRNLARWQSFVWSDSAIGVHWASVLGQILFPTQELTALEDLSFQCKNCGTLLPALIAGVPSLSSLEVVLENGDLPTMLLNQPWLGRLKKLTFIFRGHHRLAPFGPIVAECTALEELNLRRRSHSLPSCESFDSAGWRPLPRGLRTVSLHAHANFWPCASGLHITSLALRITDNTWETLSVAPRSISLPSLTKLTCLSYPTTFTAGYLLDAPMTQSVYISHWKSGSTTANSPTRDIFPDKPWGMYPTKVLIEAAYPDRASLQDLFLRFSKINTLSLCFYSTSVDALLVLIPDLDGGSGTVVCPNLTRVECKFGHKPTNSEASPIDSHILAIQDKRGDMGLPRPSVNVRWMW
jgi:hypothetical protein